MTVMLPPTDPRRRLRPRRPDVRHRGPVLPGGLGDAPRPGQGLHAFEIMRAMIGRQPGRASGPASSDRMAGLDDAPEDLMAEAKARFDGPDRHGRPSRCPACSPCSITSEGSGFRSGWGPRRAGRMPNRAPARARRPRPVRGRPLPGGRPPSAQARPGGLPHGGRAGSGRDPAEFGPGPGRQRRRASPPRSASPGTFAVGVIRTTTARLRRSRRRSAADLIVPRLDDPDPPGPDRPTPAGPERFRSLHRREIAFRGDGSNRSRPGALAPVRRADGDVPGPDSRTRRLAA